MISTPPPPNKRVRYLAVSKEPWDISEVIWDKHGINKNIPGLGPQKKYSSRATSAAEKACLVEWPLTDACANEIPNSSITPPQNHGLPMLVPVTWGPPPPPILEVPWYIGVNPWLWFKGLRVRFPSVPGTFVLQQDTWAPLHKMCVWTQIWKIKRKSLMRDSDWLKIKLRLIFLICV